LIDVAFESAARHKVSREDRSIPGIEPPRRPVEYRPALRPSSDTEALGADEAVSGDDADGEA
jgi:hypothetical protein